MSDLKLLNTSLVATRLKCIGTIVLTTSKIVAISNLFLLAAAVVAVLAAPSPLDARATWTCINKQLNPRPNKWEDKRLVYNQAKAEQLSPRTAIRQQVW
ncbi:hypothetical protein CDV55_107655 [Aspergillus turcosus]|nr:hypothetical protein CDV55_107655 [Aspergillus turcosus]